MGSSSSKFLPVPMEDVKTLRATTKFTHGEINYLYIRFRELGEVRGRKRILIKKDFDFPSYALHSIIINELFGDKNRINFVEFAQFLHLFKVLDRSATPAERNANKTKKLKLLFSMYDLNKDGGISKYELLEIVYRLFSDYADIHTIVHIAKMVLREMNPLNLNEILFVDFCKFFEPFDMEQLCIKFPAVHHSSRT